MKLSFTIVIFLTFSFVQAQEYYHNEIYNLHNQVADLSTDVVVNGDSYVVFSSTSIYSEDNSFLGEMILMREFDFEGDLINSDSLEVFDCPVYAGDPDNVIKTSDGGYMAARYTCSGHLFKFNENLQLEWELTYPETYGLFTIKENTSGYILSGGVFDESGDEDI